MQSIKVGSIVRLSDEYLNREGSFDADTLGIVREVYPARDKLPTRARVIWDDGNISNPPIRNLEEYRGVVPFALKEEWGIP